MSTIELGQSFSNPLPAQEEAMWSAEAVQAHINVSGQIIEPPASDDELEAISGLLNGTEPLTQDEMSIRWEIVMAREPGHNDPRYLLLSSVWKTLRS